MRRRASDPAPGGRLDGLARERGRLCVRRITAVRLEGSLEHRERRFVVAGLEVVPAEVVLERPRPVRGVGLGLGEREPALGPLDHPVRVGDRDHVGRVAGKEVELRVECVLERRLEQRHRHGSLAARP
jgi:hypothetical protein